MHSRDMLTTYAFKNANFAGAFFQLSRERGPVSYTQFYFLNEGASSYSEIKQLKKNVTTNMQPVGGCIVGHCAVQSGRQ